MLGQRNTRPFLRAPAINGPPYVLWWPLDLRADAGLFVFAYSVYFFLTYTRLSGFMQTSFFFGAMLIVCYASFLMLGAAGYHGSRIFVRLLYRSVVDHPAEELPLHIGAPRAHMLPCSLNSISQTPLTHCLTKRALIRIHLTEANNSLSLSCGV